MMTLVAEILFGIPSDKTKLKQLREAVKKETKVLEEAVANAKLLGVDHLGN